MGVCHNPPKLDEHFSEDHLVSAFSGTGQGSRRMSRRASGIFLSTKRKARVSGPKSLVTSNHKETLKKCHGILHDLAQCKTRGKNWNLWINEIINHLEEIKLKTIAQEASDQAKELLLAALTKGSEEDKEIGLHFRRLTNMVRGESWRDLSNGCPQSASLPLNKGLLLTSVKKCNESSEKKGVPDKSLMERKNSDKNPFEEIVYLLGDQKKTSQAAKSLNFGQFRTSTYIEQFPSLMNIRSWNFDIFGFSRETNSKPLSTLFLYISVHMNIESVIPGINLQKLSCFIQEVESNYGGNPYHNFMHGADVLHSSFNIMQASFCQEHLDLVHRFTLLFAAAVHDFSHPGVSNDFLVNTGSEIATTYNDTSVLENWHTSQAFSILKKPEFNFLEKVDAPIKSIIRTNTIEAVLMTDMKRHGEHVKELQHIIENRNCANEMVDPRKLISYALHVSDLSHPTKRFDIHMEWSTRLSNEFLAQGDRELELGMEPAALFDRRKVNIVKGQIGFIEFIILPLWINWTSLIGADDEWINQVNLNKERWRRRGGVESQEKESRSSTPSDVEVKEEDKRRAKPFKPNRTQVSLREINNKRIWNMRGVDYLPHVYPESTLRQIQTRSEFGQQVRCVPIKKVHNTKFSEQREPATELSCQTSFSAKHEDKTFSSECGNETKNSTCAFDDSSFTSMSRLLKPCSATPSNQLGLEIKHSASKLSPRHRDDYEEELPTLPDIEGKLSSKLLSNSNSPYTIGGNSDSYIQESRDYSIDPSITNLKSNRDSTLSAPSSVSYEFSKLGLLSATTESTKKLDWAKIDKF